MYLQVWGVWGVGLGGPQTPQTLRSPYVYGSYGAEGAIARAQRARSAPERALYQQANTKIFRIPHRVHTRMTKTLVQGREAAIKY